MNPSPRGPSRRGVLGGALAAVAWTQIGTLSAAEAAPGSTPAGFPADLDLHRKVFRNWDETIRTDALWTCAVRSADEVVRVVRWARSAGYRVRPRGFGHSWSPLVIDPATPTDTRVVLVDTSALSSTHMESRGRVRVGAGASMENLMQFLSVHGRSLVGAPAPGDVSVGGVLAVNGHGTNLPGPGETTPAGATYGTVSNTVVELTAVVWDSSARTYRLRTLRRSDPDIAALLVNLGRAFITEVVLQTVPAYMLRCRSTTAIHRRELFAPPERAGSRSLSTLLERHGRVGLIWFAMTDYPWVQTWDVAPQRPLTSRHVTRPYNFGFADNLPDEVAKLVSAITRGSQQLTPVATHAQLAAAAAGLVAWGASDLWGEAKNIIHFVKPTTLRVSAGSHVVITRRDQVQQVVHSFTEHYLGVIDRFRRQGSYPANNTCEIRVTGLDRPQDVGIPGAQTATLSGAAPVPGRPDLDTAVWLDVLVLPGTSRADELYMALEQWFTTLPAALGVARPEWAKRFATSAAGPWTDEQTMRRWIPRQVDGWAGALATLDRLDPHGVFRAPIHDRLMPRGRSSRS